MLYYPLQITFYSPFFQKDDDNSSDKLQLALGEIIKLSPHYVSKSFHSGTMKCNLLHHQNQVCTGIFKPQLEEVIWKMSTHVQHCRSSSVWIVDSWSSFFPFSTNVHIGSFSARARSSIAVVIKSSSVPSKMYSWTLLLIASSMF